MDQATFGDLIKRVRAGDQAAAAELVRRYEPQIRLEVRVRLRMQDARLRRVFDSMDICQSVLASFFTRAAAGQYDLDQPQQLQRLLVKMAQNKLLEQVRHEQRGRRDIRRVSTSSDEAMPTVSGDEPSPAQVVANRDLLAAVRNRLAPEEQRIADLRGQGREWAEVAQEMGGTAESRRKQFTRALDRVCEDLGIDLAMAE